MSQGGHHPKLRGVNRTVILRLVTELTWSQVLAWRLQRRHLTVAIEPFGRIPKTVRSAAEPLATFLGDSLELTWE
jgi:hypothetical protein